MTKKKKILVVDDDAVVRNIIRQELEKSGYEVVEAEDGVRALSQITNGTPPDLITLDIDMPGMDGFEACKKLQQEKYARLYTNHEDQRVPIIFVTAKDNLDDRKKGFELGATDFIAKPFAKGEITAAIDKLLHSDTHLKNLTALIVDDNKTDRWVVVKTMRRKGVTVIEAENGKDAFEIIKEKMTDIDILITDLMMPVMNGNELCKKIRKELNLKELPIIVLTGISEQEALLDLFKAGCTDYLVKPFAQEELIARSTVHLERAKLTKNLMATIKSLRVANEKIEILSITDPLTGCFNRGYLSQQLVREISRAKRYNHHLSVILCDIDHFKKVNDTYGHHTGDQVLKTFVKCIMKGIRHKIDWISRYGGEEFIVILPETAIDGAETLAERLRIAVSQANISVDGNNINITSSFGVTGIDHHTSDESLSLENFVRTADKFLYQAKKEGRDMVKAGAL